MSATVAVLKCAGCGKLAVAINSRRVTRHKCAGMWTAVLEEKVAETEIAEALKERLEP